MVAPGVPVAPSSTWLFVVGGALVGFAIGYLFRPAMLGVQLPFWVVVTRGETLSGLEALARPLAQQSFNLVLAGSVIGAVAGYAFYRFSPGAPHAPRAGAATPQSTPPREERACPWCAETILAAAKICKHCGRNV